jgi:hypothetical protein
MDYFYDGQIRRYVTQFMRVFIGFKYQDGAGEQLHVPVLYGDMTRQVASIIKDNSENKMPTVPRIACYISGIDLDMSRMSDATFVSKVNVRERRYDTVDGEIDYQNAQGGNYTVERLMPTPFTLSMKADIWTSNTDQKLQLFEQIMVLFNPSLELQTTDNYIDWTSLSVLNVKSTNFTSRTIPQGADSDIDVCTIEFDMPIWLSPPAKVKKLGVVKSVIANVFTDAGDIVSLENLIFNRAKGSFQATPLRFRVLLFKSNTGDIGDHIYDLTLVDPSAAVLAQGLDQKAIKLGEPVDWNSLLEVIGGYKAGDHIFFKQASGFDMVGTFDINPVDPTILTVSFADDPNQISNTVIAGKTYVDAIIDPYRFNPVTTFNGQANIPSIRYLMLDDVNPNSANADGPDGWKNLNGSDPVIKANSIIEWNGSAWVEVWDPATAEVPTYIQNYRTGIQYRWDGEQWMKAFEGEYAPGYWGIVNG